MALTSRDRVRMAVSHEQPDHAPCDDSFWDDCLLRFCKEGMPATVSVADHFGFDFEHLHLDASPRLPEKLLNETDDQITFASKHGYSAVKWKHKSGALHYFDHITQTPQGWEAAKRRMIVDVDEQARIAKASYFDPFTTFPTWSGAADEYRQAAGTGRYVLLDFYGPLEATWRHHGYVDVLMDFVENRDQLAEIMNVYTDLVCATIRKGLEQGITPDGVFLIEDLGTTHGTLMSPEAYREVIKPCHARIFALAAEHGMSRFMHSDGRLHAILDDFVDIGLQVLNPIDTGSGMDLVELKRRYGRELALFGGISGRDMHDVAKSNAEIDTNIPIASRGGGYLCHSDHSVPPTVSLQRYRDILKRVRHITAHPSISPQEQAYDRVRDTAACCG